MIPKSDFIEVPTGDATEAKAARTYPKTGETIFLMFSRSARQKIDGRIEVNQPGVYFLLGTVDDEPTIYIGMAGNTIKERILHHNSTKQFWTHAIGFSASGGFFNMAHAKFMESKLTELAKGAGTFKFYSDTGSNALPISKHDELYLMGAVIPEIVEIMENVYGVHAFSDAPSWMRKPIQVSKPAPAPVAAAVTGSEVFYCEGHGQTSKAILKGGVFTVLAGSQVTKEKPSSVADSIEKLRARLLGDSVIKDMGGYYEFVRDHDMSPSAASQLVKARSSNGKVEWRTEGGAALGQFTATSSDDQNLAHDGSNQADGGVGTDIVRRAVDALGQNLCKKLKTSGRGKYESEDGTIRIYITKSKNWKGQIGYDYWHTIYPHQIDWASGKEGYIAFVTVDPDQVTLMSVQEFGKAKRFTREAGEGKKFGWHVEMVNQNGSLHFKRGGVKTPVGGISICL